MPVEKLNATVAEVTVSGLAFKQGDVTIFEIGTTDMLRLQEVIHAANRFPGKENMNIRLSLQEAWAER